MGWDWSVLEDVFLLTSSSCLQSDIDPSLNKYPRSGMYLAKYHDTVVKHITTHQQ